MTVRGPALLRSDTSEPLSHLGWNGVPFMMPQSFSDYLELGAYFGTKIPSVYPRTDGVPSVADRTTGDHSWNGRHGKNFGASPGTDFFASGPTAYYTLGLTGDELVALGGGQWTILVVADFINSTLSMAVGTHQGNASPDGFGFGRNISGGSNYQFTTQYTSFAEPTPLLLTDNVAWSGLGPEVFVATARYDGSVQEGHLYGRQPISHAFRDAGTMVLPGPVGGAVPIRVGRSIDNNFTNTSNIYAVLAFSKAFSFVECQTLMTAIKDFLLTKSITVQW